MPQFRKLSLAEIPAAKVPTPSARAQIAQAYDALLADFVVGEYGRAELDVGEQRDSVRNRLHAAARRRGLMLRFRTGPGPLIFCVEAVSVPVVVEAATKSNRVPPQSVIPPRRQRQERRPAGRYDDVLPRWMRAGHPSGRRDKRRTT